MSLPKQSQMMLPLLASIDQNGGSLRPKEAYSAIAEALDIPELTTSQTENINGRDVNIYERAVRWTRQTAVLHGYINAANRGLWNITTFGKNGLRNQAPGKIITVFETDSGAAIWASAEDAVSFIQKESCDLIFTSPPYPLITEKTYGNLATTEWLEWIERLATDWASMLSKTGSLMLNVGPCYEPGRPTQSTYIERMTLMMTEKLGYHLLDRLYWHNPAKMAAPTQWVALKRVRVKPSIEPILWFSQNPDAKADNRRVLVPYSDAMIEWKKREQKTINRPSGHIIDPKNYTLDAGGAIPYTLITASNSSSRDSYRTQSKEADIPLHPATFPANLPEFAIKLTTEQGDVVYDPFFGSGTTGETAEKLGRRWIGTEKSLTYLAGAAKRFNHAKLHVETP